MPMVVVAHLCPSGGASALIHDKGRGAKGLESYALGEGAWGLWRQAWRMEYHRWTGRMVAERHKAGDAHSARPGTAVAEGRPKAELQAVAAHPLPDEDDTDRGPTALARPQQLVGRYRL